MAREIALPFRVDPQGRVAMTTDPLAQGKQHLVTFLLTRPGERVGRAGFGSQLQDSVFEALDEVTATLLLTRVRDSVAAFVPGVALQHLSAPLSSDTATLSVNVEFALAVGAGTGVTSSTEITMGGTA